MNTVYKVRIQNMQMGIKAIILLVIIFCRYTNGTPQRSDGSSGAPSKDIIKECQAESGVSENEAEQMKTSVLARNEQSGPQKCYVVCLLGKKFMIANGKLNTAILFITLKLIMKAQKKPFDDEYFKKEIGACNEQAEGQCTDLYNAWKCYRNLFVKHVSKKPPKANGETQYDGATQYNQQP